ncbi:hypothetical protein EDD22DRAFT_845579 [Suillus occidentalis]|nr:hypothetical protein EDD22DRAFT_845579 [Suillus occidentalis]
MIEDTKDSSQGALIDWEFATCITSDNLYSAGSTGTIPFISISALWEMGKLNYQYSQGVKSVKLATDYLTPQKMPMIKLHTMTTLNRYVLQIQYCNQVRGQLAAQEEKAGRKKGTRLIGDGLPRYHTQECNGGRS